MLAGRMRMAAAGAGGGVLLYDTFTDTDGTAIGSHSPDINTAGNSYTDVLATCVIQSNQATCDDSGNIVSIDIGIDGGFTATVEYTVNLVSHGGFCFRISSASAYIVIGNDNGGANFIIGYRTGGGLINVASTPFAFSPGATYTIVVTVDGASGITATIDGGNEISGTAAVLTGNNTVGWKGRSGATFDNLEVTA